MFNEIPILNEQFFYFSHISPYLGPDPELKLVTSTRLITLILHKLVVKNI